MPATLTVTSSQIAALHEILEEDHAEVAIFQELAPTLGRPVEVWVLSETSPATQHRNVIIEEDGKVVSDMMVDD